MRIYAKKGQWKQPLPFFLFYFFIFNKDYPKSFLVEMTIYVEKGKPTFIDKEFRIS